MKTLCKEIKNTVSEFFDGHYEIEYLSDIEDTITVDIRLIGAYECETNQVEWALHSNGRITKYADKIGAEVPSKEEIKYAFSGIPFERIFVEFPDGVNLNTEEDILIIGGEDL